MRVFQLNGRPGFRYSVVPGLPLRPNQRWFVRANTIPSQGDHKDPPTVSIPENRLVGQANAGARGLVIIATDILRS